ncbi:hypothetical protein B9S53_18960 [Arthrospira sp. O9.13F]|nr:hypothetical protein B9S53_18960 [Arthrospira sp. O9.13F]
MRYICFNLNRIGRNATTVGHTESNAWEESHLWARRRLGVESKVAFTPSHSEPYMRLSPHTAPSLTASLLRVQQPLFIKSCFIIAGVAM